MATGSATSADQSPQAEDAWAALDPETRARVPFLDPEDFTVGPPEAQADWASAMDTLDRAKNVRTT